MAQLSIVITAKDLASGVMQSVAQSALGLQGQFSALHAALVGVGLAGFGALKDGITGSIGAAATFEQSLADVRAATGATTQQMAALRDEALAIGKDTSKSASEAAAAMGELLRAGISIEDVTGGAGRSVVQLAEAMGASIAEMAVLFADTRNQFNALAGSFDETANTLARAANASSITIQDLGLSLKYVAPVARSMGVSLEETAALVGVLGAAGIKADTAGTALRTMLTNLSSPSTKAAEAMKTLGLNVFDASGRMLPVVDVLRQLQQGTARLSQQQQLDALSELFGKEALAAGVVLAREGASALTGMVDAMRAAPSVAETSATRLDALSGAIEVFKGSLETLQIQIGQQFLPIATQLVRWATDALTAIMALDWSAAQPGLEALGQAMTRVFESLGNNALEALALMGGDGAGLAALPAIVGAIATGLARAIDIAVDAFNLLHAVARSVATGSGEELAHWGAMLLQLLASLAAGVADRAVAMGRVLAAQAATWGAALWSWAQEAAGPTLQTLGQWAQQVWAWVSEQARALAEQLRPWAHAFWQWIVDSAPGVLRALSEWAQGLWTWVQQGAAALREQMGPWADALIGWLNEHGPGAIKAAADWIYDVGSAIVGALAQALPGVIAQLAQWGQELVAWIEPRLPAIIAALTVVQRSLLEWARERVLPDLERAAGEWAQALARWVGETALPALGQALEQLARALAAWAAATGRWLAEQALQWGAEFGRSLGQALTQAIAGVTVPLPKIDLDTSRGLPRLTLGLSQQRVGDLLGMGASPGELFRDVNTLLGRPAPSQPVVVNINAPTYGVNDLETIVRQTWVEAQRRGFGAAGAFA